LPCSRPHLKPPVLALDFAWGPYPARPAIAVVLEHVIVPYEPYKFIPSLEHGPERLELKIATYEVSSNSWAWATPLGTALGPESPVFAVDSDDHHVYLGWGYFTALKNDPDAQGELIVHELLHEAFGSHIDIANALGLRDGNGEKYTDNAAAIHAIDDFLNGNCH
jgi:hypothetical protein